MADLKTFTHEGNELNFDGRFRGIVSDDVAAGVHYGYEKDGVLSVLYPSKTVDDKPCTNIAMYTYNGDLMDIQQGHADIGSLVEFIFQQITDIVKCGNEVTADDVVNFCQGIKPELTTTYSNDIESILMQLKDGKSLAECVGDKLSHVYRNPASEGTTRTGR